ncbi:hypothetical protein BDN72DRAFT_321713 [Pluteus cervinus]|uniref:Uncharacterized protein n=1 Tax=Pluteus cervinus TaxID=181527 RepID=A0ACD3ACX5_9AGAR|nr:hypothetical protein BDN72DRAFT_321713 [Pluteus cervinus]
MSLSVLNLLETGVRDIQLTRYAALASSVIIVYDHLITIDAEVTLIWRSSWSLGKVLFIINRYYTLLSVAYYDYALFSPYLTDEVSLIFFKWQGWTGLFAFVIAEIILQMRLYALYFLNKKVLFLMVFLFVGSVSASGVILALLLQKITMVDSHPGAGIVFCTPTGLSHSFWTFWVPLLGFETFLCIMALFRGFQTFKKDGSLFQSGRHLVRILIRDSVLFYLVMFGAYFTNVLMWLLARQTLLEVPIGFSVALSCVLGNRIILNVRQVNRDLDLTKTRQKKRRRRPGSTSWVDRAAGDSASVYPGGNGGGNRGQETSKTPSTHVLKTTKPNSAWTPTRISRRRTI